MSRGTVQSQDSTNKDLWLSNTMWVWNVFWLQLATLRGQQDVIVRRNCVGVGGADSIMCRPRDQASH